MLKATENLEIRNKRANIKNIPGELESNKMRKCPRKQSKNIKDENQDRKGTQRTDLEDTISN